MVNEENKEKEPVSGSTETSEVKPPVVVEVGLSEGEGKKEVRAEEAPADFARRRDGRGKYKQNLDYWVPKTHLGTLVSTGEITNIGDIYKSGLKIKEPEIVDKLFPNLQEEVIEMSRVQKTTMMGRTTKFRVIAIVGNMDGYVGIGVAKGKEAGPSIQKATRKAKLNLHPIRRGCGNGRCMCREPHSIPFTVSGKMGSIKVKIMPASKGTGIVGGERIKKILLLAGIRDVRVRATKGHTRTTINFANAVMNALINTNYVKFREEDAVRLEIVSGQKVGTDTKPNP